MTVSRRNVRFICSRNDFEIQSLASKTATYSRKLTQGGSMNAINHIAPLSMTGSSCSLILKAQKETAKGTKKMKNETAQRRHIPPAGLHRVLASGSSGGMLDSSPKSRIFGAEPVTARG